MLRIDPQAIGQLPESQQAHARELLDAYEQALRHNPLLGYEPHEKQKPFHANKQRLKAFLGGNQSGKTTAGILDDIFQAVDKSCLPEHLLPYKKWEPPFRCRVIAPDFTEQMEGVIFEKIREWCPKSQFVGDSFDRAYSKQERRLRFKNGSWFSFMTFEQDLDKFGGASLERIHYDEEPPLAIRKESRIRLVSTGGDELFTMTPLKGMSWMFDKVWEPWVKGTLTDGFVVTVDMDDNPHLAAADKAAVLEDLTEEEKQARKSGRFVHFAGMIYDDFSRNHHVIPEIREVPAGARVYVGIDPGVRHMAAVVWCYLNVKNTLVVFDELALQGRTVKQVAEAIQIVNHKWGQRLPDGKVMPLVPEWYVIDPSARNVVHQTGKSDQAEFFDHGIMAILGQNSVTAGINRVKERLQAHRLLVTANCQELIDQFRKYRWATPTRAEDDPKEKPVKSQDHLLDALRYVIASRPYTPEESEEERSLSPMERAMREEISGRTHKRKKLAGWQFA